VVSRGPAAVDSLVSDISEALISLFLLVFCSWATPLRWITSGMLSQKPTF
jgi:hypothetical protein